jgi:hypothetical protein
MNDEELESAQRDLAEPVLPAAWRAPILARARREATVLARGRNIWPALLLYLRRIFLENQLTTGGLTVVWLLILILKAGTPVGPSEKGLIAQVNPSRPIYFVSLQDEVRLAELWQDQPEPRQIP